MARQSRHLSVTQKSALNQGRALQKLFETGLPPDEPQTKAPSTQCRKEEQDVLQRRRDAEQHNSSAMILKLPYEVFAMVCFHMSKKDMFGCLIACKPLYLAVVPHLWHVLRLKFTNCKVPEEVRKRQEDKDAERRAHKDWKASLAAVGISKQTRRQREKGMKRDPRISKTFEGLRLNVLRPRNRLIAMVPLIRALVIKEPYQAWSERAFARTFQYLFPVDFHFSVNMTCFRYESVDSNIDQNSMLDTLQAFCRLLPPPQTSLQNESDHTPIRSPKRKRDADDSTDSQPVKLQRTEGARDTSEGVQGNILNYRTCIHGVRMGDPRFDSIPRCLPCYDEKRTKEKYSTAMKYMDKVLQEFRPHITGSIISRLDLRGLAAVGVTFITQLTVLFPNVTKLTLCTGGPNASDRWKLGQCLRVLLRVFSQFRHLCYLKTNSTVHLSLRANPLDPRHNPIPSSPDFHQTLRPIYNPGRHPGSLARPTHHVPLYLDRLPRQMETYLQALVCRDQWLRTHKCLLQEFGREWLWVQRNAVLEKSCMPLRSVTCLFGDLMKQEITFDAELASDPQVSYGVKFAADLPDDIIDLGIRDYTKGLSANHGSKLFREFNKLGEEYAVSMQNVRVRNWHACFERDLHEGVAKSLNYLDLVHIKPTFDYPQWYRDHGRQHVGTWECEMRDPAEAKLLGDQLREKALEIMATIDLTPEHRGVLENLFMSSPQSQLASA